MKSEIQHKIDLFKDRKIKAKKIFTISEISKEVAYDFVKKVHYLGDAKFFSMYSFGLFIDNELVGVSTYAPPQGISSMKGWFGLPNTDKTVQELYRLAIIPQLNGSNATSFLLRGSMKKLNKEYNIRAIITLADSSRHVGSIYQVCGFKYYGLTQKNSDFYTHKGVNIRGKTKGVKGVRLPRTRKHRYAVIYDNTLKCNYEEKEYPKNKSIIQTECCKGYRIVFDKRLGDWYYCPKCNGKLQEITNPDNEVLVKMLIISHYEKYNQSNNILLQLKRNGLSKNDVQKLINKYKVND